MIYLDYAAASPALPEMFASLVLFYGGRKEEAQARAQIAQLLSGSGPAGAFGMPSDRLEESAGGREIPSDGMPVSPEEIIFTSGGTESDNLAVLGTFFRAKREGRPLRILTSAAEHEAVLQAVRAAEEYGEIFGVNVKTRVLPVTPEGAVDPEMIRETLREIREEQRCVSVSAEDDRKAECASDPLILASFMYGNNETGVLTDVEKIGRICHEAGALFHTDAVQAVGHIGIDLQTLPVDMLSASAHKFGGPKGTGFLYVRKGVELEPMLFGEDTAGSPAGLRAGCSYGILGMAQALRYRMAHLAEEETWIRRLRDLLQEGILKEIPGTHVNGGGLRLPGHLNVSFDGVESASLLFMLDMKGVCASGGSACAAQSHAPSHVLSAMGLGADRVSSAVRFSLGPEITESEIQETLRILKETVSELRLLRGL